jgi:4-hydroxy-tetrahydrodipicolinate synthase
MFSDMIHLALLGKIKEARKMHYSLLKLMNINFVESNPIPVKSALSMMGMIEESLRLPLTPLEEKNKDSIAKILKTLKLIK